MENTALENRETMQYEPLNRNYRTLGRVGTALAGLALLAGSAGCSQYGKAKGDYYYYIESAATRQANAKTEYSAKEQTLLRDVLSGKIKPEDLPVYLLKSIEAKKSLGESASGGLSNQGLANSLPSQKVMNECLWRDFVYKIFPWTERADRKKLEEERLEKQRRLEREGKIKIIKIEKRYYQQE